MSRPPSGSQNSYPQQLGPVQQPIPLPSPNQGTADNKNINGVVYAIFEGYPDGMSQAAIKAGARRIPPQEPIQKCFRPTETITFSEEDVVPTVTPHTDALVVKAIIANKEVRRVHIDQGSAVDVMYFDCFSKLGLDVASINPTNSPLTGFGTEVVKPMGIVPLAVTIRTYPGDATFLSHFYVINALSPFNVIIGRPWLNAAKAIPSTYHIICV